MALNCPETSPHTPASPLSNLFGEDVCEVKRMLYLQLGQEQNIRNGRERSRAMNRQASCQLFNSFIEQN